MNKFERLKEKSNKLFYPRLLEESLLQFSKKGIPLSEEHKRRISEGRKKRNGLLKKRIGSIVKGGAYGAAAGALMGGGSLKSRLSSIAHNAKIGAAGQTAYDIVGGAYDRRYN